MRQPRLSESKNRKVFNRRDNITKAICEGDRWYSAIVVLPRQAALEVQPVAGTREDAQIKPAQGRHYARIRPMAGALDAISGLENFISKDRGFAKEAGR